MPQAPYVPTDEARAQIEAMTIAGVSQKMMSKVLGISAPTLRKHYHETIEVALEKAISSVSNTLLQKALAGDTASIIFFLKVRGKKHGWTERLEIGGADGGPIHTVQHVVIDPPPRE